MTTVLITGANRGIGYALTETLIKRGDRVIAMVRDPFQLPDLLKTAPREQMMVIGMDVTDQRSVDRAAAAVDEPIDVLVNNAGVYGPRGANGLDVDLAAFVEVMAVNTIAPLRVARTFLPQLKQGRNPRILTVSSQMGALSGSAQGSIAYRVSKAAVNKTMQCLATDLKPDGVTAIVLHPGWVQTDMGGSSADISPTESAAGIARLIDTITLNDTGKFFRWDGTIHPW